jgi:hypothetical protein
MRRGRDPEGRIKHNTGALNSDELRDILKGRNKNFLLASRRIGRNSEGRMVRTIKASDFVSGSWDMRRVFPEREIWRDFLGVFLVKQHQGDDIKELYRGPDPEEALAAYNKEVDHDVQQTS